MAVNVLTLKTGPTGCFETSVANHQPTPNNNPGVWGLNYTVVEDLYLATGFLLGMGGISSVFGYIAVSVFRFMTSP